MKKKFIIQLLAIMIVSSAVGVTFHSNMVAKNEIIESIEKDVKNKNEENESLKIDIDNINKSLETLKEENKKLNTELERARQNIDRYTAITSFNHLNALDKSNATKSHMKRALKDTGLYYYSEYFVEAEEIYGVNAYFIAAIAAFESSWGKSNRAINQNNLTGYAVYSSASRGKDFGGGIRENILETSRLLKEEYLTQGGESFNGYKVEDVNTKYCLDESGTFADYNWCTNIISIAYDLKNKGNNFN